MPAIPPAAMSVSWQRPFVRIALHVACYAAVGIALVGLHFMLFDVGQNDGRTIRQWLATPFLHAD